MFTALTTACSSTISNLKPFKLEIQQGNVVTSKMLLQLRPGMTKSQVRYIMGTPLIVDSFHGNRWDYVFQLRQSGKITEQRRVVLIFDSELLKTVRGDVMSAGVEAGEGVVKLTPAAERTAPKNRDTKDNTGESFIDKLKFWKEKPAIEADKKIELAPVGAQPTSSNVDHAVAPANVKARDKAEEDATSTAPLSNSPALTEPAMIDEMSPQEPLMRAPAIGPRIEPTIDQKSKNDASLKPVPQTILPKPVVVPAAKSKPATKPSEPLTLPVEPTPLQNQVTNNNIPLSTHELKIDRTLEPNQRPKEAPSSSSANANANKSEESDETPGYLERILEKIGF